MISNNLTTVEFKGHALSLIHHADDVWMTSEAIGQALEYQEPRDAILKIYERNRDELNEYSATVKLTATDGKAYNTRVFNEEGIMLLCMFSNQPKAKEFRKWAVTILKAHRHGSLGQHDPEKQQLLNLLQRATETIRMQTVVIQDFNAYLRGDDKREGRFVGGRSCYPLSALFNPLEPLPIELRARPRRRRKKHA